MHRHSSEVLTGESHDLRDGAAAQPNVEEKREDAHSTLSGVSQRYAPR